MLFRSGQGAAIKRLALMPISDAVLGPVADAGGPRIPVTGSLRDALDLIVLSGVARVTVTDPDGVAMGTLDHAAISHVLGTTVEVSALGADGEATP